MQQKIFFVGITAFWLAVAITSFFYTAINGDVQIGYTALISTALAGAGLLCLMSVDEPEINKTSKDIVLFFVTVAWIFMFYSMLIIQLNIISITHQTCFNGINLPRTAQFALGYAGCFFK